MTLSDRNNIFKAGIAISSLCLLIVIAGSFRAIPVYRIMEPEVSRRSLTVFRLIIGKYLPIKLLAVHICILILVLYSFLSVILIYYYFEKTQSPEILFIVLFAASFAPEALRLILPLSRVYEIPSLYLLMSSRIILTGRYFGIFSLFTASLFAVGYRTQQQSTIIIIIVIATLIIALGVPIDTQSWDSSLTMVNGYISMFRLIESGIFLITTVTFFIAAWSRGSREFAFIGAGSVLVFLGRNILLSTDTWAGPPIGLAFLAAGTWLICTKLHKVYLWL